MGGFAWVTLATNDSYSLGALVLAHSLRRVNTAHQLVVLITPSVTEAMRTQLGSVFNVVKVVDVLDSKDADNLALLARPELGITFTKLHCWRLTEYEKCVFLDADTLVLQNSDELFGREELSAAPDAGWPDCFNSGVFVYKPSNETFKALMEFALVHGSFDGGDQGLLNLFFKDWATKDITKHLPFVYNMCSTATYSYLPAFKQFGEGLKIVHFIGAAKPWLQPFNTESGLVQVSGESQHVRQFVQLWWDLFCSNVHPSLSSEMAGLAGALASVTLGDPLSTEQTALAEHLRRQGWEQGHIDYMGKDSFANIWQKICDTLAAGSQPPSMPTLTTAASEPVEPVAPIAAPTFVSSVEISPSGPIDTSPPASYVPVSALTPTVVDSDTEAASKAAPAETTAVAPESKSSFAEVTSSALGSSLVSSDSSEKQESPKPAALQPEAVSKAGVPVTPALVGEVQPSTLPAIPLPSPTQDVLSSTTTPAAQVKSAPAPATPAENKPALVENLQAPITSAPAPAASVEIKPAPGGSAPTPAVPAEPKPVSAESAPSLATPVETKPASAESAPALATTVKTKPASAESAPAPSTPIEIKPASAELAPAPAAPIEMKPAPGESSPAPLAPVETKPASAESVPASAAPSEAKPVPAESVPASAAPAEAKPASSVSPPTPTAPAEVKSASATSAKSAPAPSESMPAPVPLPDSTTIPTAPLEGSPAATVPAESKPAFTPSSEFKPDPATVESKPVPAGSVEMKPASAVCPESKSAPAPPTETKPSPTASVETKLATAVPAESKLAPAPPAESKSPPAPTAETKSAPEVPSEAPVAPEIPKAAEPRPSQTQPTPVQPQTPTVTEPTPPTSPSVVPVDSAKLQVESSIPATPPVESGASQPSLATASGEEPPVPPKRKGGAKPQEHKNQKGGKQSKGKK